MRDTPAEAQKGWVLCHLGSEPPSGLVGGRADLRRDVIASLWQEPPH